MWLLELVRELELLAEVSPLVEAPVPDMVEPLIVWSLAPPLIVPDVPPGIPPIVPGLPPVGPAAVPPVWPPAVALEPAPVPALPVWAIAGAERIRAAAAAMHRVRISRLSFVDWPRGPISKRATDKRRHWFCYV
ncbi:MAG: hypothetical protein JO157_07800 [Acetobacteraceae bacterium]|nr:hypothetical protein [Acetobacteraceae bacterium]